MIVLLSIESNQNTIFPAWLNVNKPYKYRKQSEGIETRKPRCRSASYMFSTAVVVLRMRDKICEIMRLQLRKVICPRHYRKELKRKMQESHG